MQVRFYNTLTRRLESFDPIDPPRVSMYNCGPTVYDYAHIGNFRTFVFADLLRRFLELIGLDVHQVMNITDVGHMTEDQLADGGGEDKMQVAAARIKEAKKLGRLPPGSVDDPDDPYQVAQFYTDAFLADARALGLKVAGEYPQRMPHATQHVPQMQAMIERLIERGHAYVADDGAVYFAVESFPPYGRLSGNTLANLRGGAGGRVLDAHQALKRHPNDFLMWKPDASHIMKWPSPWGTGYPGWHIECSAMATHLLGRDVIDLHTGGEDNIFPHHECEIAQSRGASGREHFARFWLHTRYLLVEGRKMSKSAGTFFTVRDVLAGSVTGRAVDPAVLRYDLLRTHYRSNVNFTRKGLQDSASAVRRLRDVAGRLEAAGVEAAGAELDHPIVRDFSAALADDLNVAGALAVLFKWLDEPHPDAAAALGVLRQVDRVLGVLRSAAPSSPDAGDQTLEASCKQIDDARAAKNYVTADRLRQQLVDAGYEVQTTAGGTTARKQLA